MKSQRTIQRFALFIAGLAALAMFPAVALTRQGVPPSPSQTGSVTGILRMPDGTPAAGVRITALRAEAVNDAVRAMASLTQTDSTGRYTLQNVPAGRYYITAGRVDLPTYYPGTIEVAKGTVVSITSAAVVSDIDFVFQDTSAFAPAAPGLRGGRGGRGGPPNSPAAGVLGTAGVLGGFAQQQDALNNAVQGGRRGPGQTNPNAPVPPLPPGGITTAAGVNFQRGGAVTGTTGATTAAWWTNAALVARLGLTEDQKKRIEAVFEQYRQSLVAGKADLDREEASLARMLEAEAIEPAKVSSQIDRVVQARAEMERTNSRMTLEMRQKLTRAQWIQLQAETTQPAVPILTTPAGGRGGGARGGGPGVRGGAIGTPGAVPGGRSGGPAPAGTPPETSPTPEVK
jgi:hypothetical protein